MVRFSLQVIRNSRSYAAEFPISAQWFIYQEGVFLAMQNIKIESNVLSWLVRPQVNLKLLLLLVIGISTRQRSKISKVFVLRQRLVSGPQPPVGILVEDKHHSSHLMPLDACNRCLPPVGGSILDDILLHRCRNVHLGIFTEKLRPASPVIYP